MKTRKTLISLVLAGTGISGGFGCDSHSNKYEFRKEILSEWQVERSREYTLRNRNFECCDENKDGMLSGSEFEKYKKITLFNYRFR